MTMLRIKQKTMIVVAAALLAACSEEAPLNPVEGVNNPIVFGSTNIAAVNDAETRGRIIENNRHIHDNMNVYAYTWLYDGNFDAMKVNTDASSFVESTDVGVLMNPETVRLLMPVPGDEYWYYSPIKRWPERGKVRFYAYTPEIENPAILQVSNTHVPTLDYTMPAELRNQKELMIATPVERNMAEHRTSEVKFTFNHVLSAVRFKIDNSVTTDLVIKSIKLEKLNNHAEFSLENAQMIGSPDGDANYELDFASIYPSDGGFKFNAASPNYDVINPLDDTFLVIPQTCGNDAAVKMTLKNGDSTETYAVTLKNTAWQAGYIYTYKIAFKNRRLILIPTVNPWNEAPVYDSFTATESMVNDYTPFKLYDTDENYDYIWDDAYIAIAPGEMTHVDINGTLVHDNVPLYSPRIKLVSSSTDPLEIVSDNPQVRFVTINAATGVYNPTQVTSVSISAGTNVETLFHVVPVEGFDTSSRIANVRVMRKLTSTHSLPLPWAHKSLPRTEDYTSVRFYLMTEAEYTSTTVKPTVDRN